VGALGGRGVRPGGENEMGGKRETAEILKLLFFTQIDKNWSIILVSEFQICGGYNA
jgi:hypothetical protein